MKTWYRVKVTPQTSPAFDNRDMSKFVEFDFCMDINDSHDQKVLDEVAQNKVSGAFGYEAWKSTRSIELFEN